MTMTMTKNRKLIIVDGNNRAWAAYHAYEKLSYKGKGVGMMYGLPSMIKALLKEHTPNEMIIVWDGCRSKHREKLLPSYKGERKHRGLVDYDDFLRQLKTTRILLNFLGVKQVLNPDCEADDLIYVLTLKARKLGYNNIIIVSGDKDFNQLISREVSVYSESKKELIQWQNCSREFGYHGWQTIDWLTLVGDKSDNIPGYRGIGEKKATEFLHKYGSIAKFLESRDEHSIINKEELARIVERNRILIDLRGYYNQYKNELKIKFLYNNPKINREKFLSLSAKYGMKSFMGSGFINQFKWLKEKS